MPIGPSDPRIARATFLCADPTRMNTGWLYLIIGSFSQACWVYAVKFMDLKKLRGESWSGIFHDPVQARALLPFVGYAVFGAGNVIFLSMSMRYIPASTAYAVFVALALLASKLIDVFYFHQAYSGMQILWFACIVVGVIGLKRSLA